MTWWRLLLLLLLACELPRQMQAQQAHIVLFVADDLSCDLGCYDNPVMRTPHIDRFAADSIRFTNAFATTASCSASRSVILSGLHNHATAQYGHEHHYHHFRTYDWIRTLPRLLHDHGYRTIRVGKFHVAPASTYPFEHVLKADNRGLAAMCKAVRPLLAERDDRPLFLYICTADPHRSGETVDSHPLAANRFGNRGPGGYPQIDVVEYQPDEVLVPPFLPDTPACRAELAQYYQAVSRVDQGFGLLTETLKRAGIYDESLILFTSDHGIAMPGAKTTVYEPGLRVPLLVKSPATSQPGQSSDALVSLVDLTPTILDFVGLIDSETQSLKAEGVTQPADIHHPQSEPVPYRFHGRSFLPLLEQPGSNGRNQVFASHTFHEIQMYYPMRAVRDRRYKLIWNIAYPLPFPFASDLWSASTWQAQWQQGPAAPFGQRTVEQYRSRPEFELFDLAVDPHEAHNLAHDPAHAAKLSELQDALRRFQRQTQDPWQMKWEYE